MCVECTDHASGDEVSAPLPASRLGRADRRLESILGRWLGPGPAVLLRDGGQGRRAISPTCSYGVVNYSHPRRAFGRRSRDTDVGEGWCDNIERGAPKTRIRNKNP